MSWVTIGAAVIGGVASANRGSGSSKGAVEKPATIAQANEQYANVQAGLQQQKDFLMALQAQNGIANQSSVFNQLQGVANGTGPNPAQAMLANSTGANVANQAALAAGQRGAGSNVGMMQRQVGQQGAGIQQNAAGQAAVLQAQQSLGALGQLGGIAQQQVGNQANVQNALNTNTLQAQNQILNSINNQNSAQASLTKQQMSQDANIISGLTGGIGTALGTLGGGSSGGSTDFGIGDNTGGQVVDKNLTMDYAQGGIVQQAPSGPKSNIGRAMLAIPMAKGGQVAAMVSPGEAYLTPKDVSQVKQGANPLAVGEKIPGKPKVKGDSYQNDTVHKDLQEGGIVIPNSIMQSKDAKKKAAEFVAAVLKKQSLKGK